MAKKTKDENSDAWYTLKGANQDIVVSTKATLARNLANFPFPSKLSDAESERIQSIVFDAFNFLNNADDFQAISINLLDDIGNKIMKERGVLVPFNGHKAGLILRNDGKISCTINTDDHLHISSFFSGMNIESASNSIYEIDRELQKHIQFAASYEFGYLTYSILNCGSALNLMAKVHLPACSFLKSIKNIAANIVGQEYNFINCYGSGGSQALSGFGGSGASLGNYYIISTKSSADGTELAQKTAMQCVLQSVIKEEKEARKICKEQHFTEVLNYALRSLSLARNSLLISLREAIDIIGGVKFGKDLGLLYGIDDTELHSLLYRVQEGHLEYVLANGKFKFEKDIQNNSQRKTERLRALILQEAFQNVEQ